MSAPDPDPTDAPADAPALTREAALTPEDILVVRRGPGANCSSIGSALDVLFLSAVAGSAILVAVAAALPTKQAGPPAPPARGREGEGEEGDARAS